MSIPFLGPRIPFELAEPGTDPTRQHNPHPKKSWRDFLPYGFLILAFLIIGYMKFVRPKQQAQAARVQPTPIVAVEPTRRGFLSSHITPSPTYTLPPSTATPIATPTPEPTLTPAGLEYGVFVDGEQIVCWCTDDGQIGPVADCLTGIPSFCDVTPSN